jgi:hypothetical protein
MTITGLASTVLAASPARLCYHARRAQFYGHNSRRHQLAVDLKIR